MNTPAEKPIAMADAQRLSQRVHFEGDGTVSVASGKVEIGQGILTALAQIAAEELDVSIERIRMLPASTAYSPDEGVTSGSLSIQDGGKGLRTACTEIRALLLRGAAERLGVSTGELSVNDGTISAGGKRTTYWECADVSGRDIPAEAQSKPPSSYKVVGKSAPRLDLPSKIAGRPSYVHDMVLPHMLYGRVVRAAHVFAKLICVPELDKSVTVVRDGNFLGVLAEREENAIAAAAKLRSKGVWEKGPELPSNIHAWLKEHVTERQIAKEKADAGARATSAKRVTAQYTKPYIAQASIGPSCAIARVTGERIEVWSHTQGIFGLRQDLSKILRMPEEKIIVTHVEGAGCYGHNGADDAALDAALLARAAGGRPVKLQWMREDEFAWEPYGAAMLMEMEAHLDPTGAIVSWRHDLYSNGHTHRPGRAELPTLTAAAQISNPLEISPAVDPALPAGGAHRNSIPLYEFPDLLVRNNYVREMPIRSSSLRALGGYGNVFAIESFMDELAAAAGSDPVSFRLKHLKDPRAKAVIDAAVERSGWKSWKPAEGRGRGIAFAKYKNLGAYCAIVAEVEAGHELKVSRIVAAVDVGIAVNPDGVINQIEGGCIQATSWTLKEGTKLRPTSWEDYPILKFSEVPRVEVHLLKNEFPSVGAGECAMGPTAAAIANALYDALGVRVRDLPLTPDQIVKAIG